MYAKVLRGAGGVDVPMLIATADLAVCEHLHARGWFPWGSGMQQDRGAVVRIMPDRLRLTVNGDALIDDPAGDPISPPGWWEGVSRMRDRIIVALVPPDTPFDAEGMKAAHARLLDSPDTAMAIVSIAHR